MHSREPLGWRAFCLSGLCLYHSITEMLCVLSTLFWHVPSSPPSSPPSSVYISLVVLYILFLARFLHPGVGAFLPLFVSVSQTLTFCHLSPSHSLAPSLTLSLPLSLSHSLSLTLSLPPSVLTAGLFPLRRKERCLPVQPPCLRVFLLCVDHCSRRKGGNPLVGCCDGVRFHSVVLLDTHTSDAMGPLFSSLTWKW